MNFTIEWLDIAFDQMQELLTTFADRRAEFASALTELSVELAADPTAIGESRGGRMRVHFYGRLTVRFIPFVDRRVVYIVGIHMPTDRI